MIKPNIKFFSLLKWCFFVCVLTITSIIIITPDLRRKNVVIENILEPIGKPLPPPQSNWRNLSQKQISSLSTLGKYLFFDESLPTTTNKIYKILTWKVGKFLERRHIYHFTNKKFDPFEKCTVRNCEIIYSEDKVPRDVDAVMIHLQRIKGVNDLPKENEPRPENQRWVFLTDENPIFTFLNGKVKIKDFNGIFNWSMTYRLESDVPVPYGRTILKQNAPDSININIIDYNENNEKSFPKRNDVLVAIMGSNCGGKNHRWQYVKELQKYITVDVYGKCGTFECPGHFGKDCELINNYKFYLSFENSNCAQYITEKLWWNAYAKNSIPIVMGASKYDYKQLLPPNSYINVDDFARPVDLARYLLYINKTNIVYQSFFEWKKYYQVANEHGFFQTDSYHYCRLCEALNFNNKDRKIYNNIEEFWTTNDCYPAWDDIKDDT